MYILLLYLNIVFFFNAPATTEISTLSLHDALPIYFEFQGADRMRDPFNVIAQAMSEIVQWIDAPFIAGMMMLGVADAIEHWIAQDRKSTRLNSSHVGISYAVFCLQKNTFCRLASHT